MNNNGFMTEEKLSDELLSGCCKVTKPLLHGSAEIRWSKPSTTASDTFDKQVRSYASSVEFIVTCVDIDWNGWDIDWIFYGYRLDSERMEID